MEKKGLFKKVIRFLFKDLWESKYRRKARTGSCIAIMPSVQPGAQKDTFIGLDIGG